MHRLFIRVPTVLRTYRALNRFIVTMRAIAAVFECAMLTNRERRMREI
jgi:hypothetical protein